MRVQNPVPLLDLGQLPELRAVCSHQPEIIVDGDPRAGDKVRPQARGQPESGVLSLKDEVVTRAAIPVLASDLKSASISVYLEQVKGNGNELVPLWSEGREIVQWSRTSFYRQIAYSH